MAELWVALGLSVLGVLIILAVSYVVQRWRTRGMVGMDRPSPYDDEFDRRAITTTLDWYILRHLEDQRRMPKRQRFLDEDRRHNGLLNRYVVHQFKKQKIDLDPIASTLEESVRPDDAAHYLARYFPDAELDSALVMFKHELIGKRLLSTIGYLRRIRTNRAKPLTSFAALKPGYTPFVPDAYVTFYNDLVAEADDFEREAGIRERMRVLAVRMIFPGNEPQLNYWRDRKVETYQIPTPVARDAIEGWFYLDLDAVPTVDSKA